MIRLPKAKINLGLRILRRRPDGYHDIETLLLPIPLRDALEVLPSEEGMKYDFGDWGEPSEENLVVRAYHLVKAAYPELPPVEIILRKLIPTGAGLGGGSSDASNMLLLLDELFELGMSYDEMHQMATRLGADCPFFLRDEPQLGEGIGEQLSPFPLHLEGKVLTLLPVSYTHLIEVNTPQILQPNNLIDLIHRLPIPLLREDIDRKSVV